MPQQQRSYYHCRILMSSNISPTSMLLRLNDLQLVLAFPGSPRTLTYPGTLGITPATTSASASRTPAQCQCTLQHRSHFTAPLFLHVHILCTILSLERLSSLSHTLPPMQYGSPTTPSPKLSLGSYAFLIHLQVDDVVAASLDHWKRRGDWRDVGWL